MAGNKEPVDDKTKPTDTLSGVQAKVALAALKGDRWSRLSTPISEICRGLTIHPIHRHREGAGIAKFKSIDQEHLYVRIERLAFLRLIKIK